VLPAALPHEHDTIGYWPSWFGFVKAYQKVVDPPGEAWPDAKMINELAKRVGLGQYFWADWQDSLDLMLVDSGLTYKELVEKRILRPSRLFLEDKEPYFQTPSGKVEFYSQQMSQLGLSPLPYFKEVASSRFEKEDFENYPLVLTNFKEGAYMLSGYRDIKAMRKRRPEAVVEIHPDTAARYGLKNGDMIYIESRKGRIQQRLKAASYIHPEVVMAAFGWSDIDEDTNQYNWRKNNLNILTDADPPNDPATGSVQFRGIPCRIYLDEPPVRQRGKSARKADRLQAT
jgi:anaerobic selenocysteine-containing dehydrogenase